MVRILSSKEDRARTEERVSVLERLTREFFADGKSPLSNVLILQTDSEVIVLSKIPLLPRNSYLEINASMNLITVYHPFYLNSAKQIAASYEKENPGNELIIRENYSSFYSLNYSKSFRQPKQAFS